MPGAAAQALKGAAIGNPCKMEAGINAEKHAPVGERLKEDVKNHALIAVTRKRRRFLKVLRWDGTGCWLMIMKSARS